MKQELIIQQIVEDFNSQQQQCAPPGKNMKVWQMLDDTIKTGRYVQCTEAYEAGNNKRCVMGVFASYRGWKGTYQDDDLLQDFIDDTIFDGERVEIGTDKQDYFNRIRRQYEEDGKINQDLMVVLNDRFNVTFEEFRDFFKEIDA
jgi:hypothetical protein